MGLALHNYHNVYMFFPAAHLNDDLGNPRISWRVSILSYMDEAPRFSKYNSNESWDSPSNSRLLNPMPSAYGCPSHATPNSTNTSYATITGASSVLGDGVCLSMKHVSDGTSNTVMVVEACKLQIPWMKPQDIDSTTITRIGDPNGVYSNHVGGAQVLLADGSVRFISNKTDPRILKALVTRDGNRDGHENFGEF